MAYPMRRIMLFLISEHLTFSSPEPIEEQAQSPKKTVSSVGVSNELEGQSNIMSA